jgi:hypothetical protein
MEALIAIIIMLGIFHGFIAWNVHTTFHAIERHLEEIARCFREDLNLAKPQFMMLPRGLMGEPGKKDESPKEGGGGRYL